ncbi:MAG: mechanosensitive ion channel [Desulfobacterium sp.]|nr:mechanosensitive ion channel [Desulfobacteraceae bacterium]MBA3037865.1 mechanosensitive ion channel [Desulfobacterium sp.]MBU3949408.1 mechanosensitive ion channel [Pseudomonadota bacterium]MBU4036709.1 mechanosensitive ion channel [Pseudomonadota bacterium]
MGDFVGTFWKNHSGMILGVGYNGLLVIIVVFASHFIAKALHGWINKTNERFEQFDETLVPILCTATSLVVYAVGLIIILDFFGVNTASIIALLGAAGLAIALALKDTLSNIAAGVMLLVLRPFRSGHFIECGSIIGTIKQVGLFTTILETPDGLYISSPNSSLWGSPIKNFTKNGKRRMDLIVGIAYSDSIDKGFDALQSVIQSEPRFMDDPAPKIMVQAMADSSVNLQLRAWARVENYWDIYWDANKKIKEQIEAAGLTIPFPQRDVHLFNEK